MDALESQIVRLRGEMRGEFSAVRSEIRSGDEETRTQMRVLHEDLVSRIAMLGEGHAGRKQIPDRKRRRSKH
jgi:hypothetical protein